MNPTDIKQITQGKIRCSCDNSDWQQFLYVGVSLDALMAGCKICGRVLLHRSGEWPVMSEAITPCEEPPRGGRI